MNAFMKTCVGLCAFALGACAVGQGEVNVTENRVATFPGAPVSAVVGESVTTDAEVTLDLKSNLDSLTNLGAVTVDISRNSISGADLATIRHIRATLATKDGKIPEQVASDLDVPEKSTELDLPLLMSDAQILAYLSEGPVILHVYLTGNIPEQSFALEYALAAHLDVAVNGSISNL
jgi:hypothetical protein